MSGAVPQIIRNPDGSETWVYADGRRVRVPPEEQVGEDPGGASARHPIFRIEPSERGTAHRDRAVGDRGLTGSGTGKAPPARGRSPAKASDEPRSGARGSLKWFPFGPKPLPRVRLRYLKLRFEFSGQLGLDAGTRNPAVSASLSPEKAEIAAAGALKAEIGKSELGILRAAAKRVQQGRGSRGVADVAGRAIASRLSVEMGGRDAPKVKVHAPDLQFYIVEVEFTRKISVLRGEIDGVPVDVHFDGKLTVKIGLTREAYVWIAKRLVARMGRSAATRVVTNLGTRILRWVGPSLGTVGIVVAGTAAGTAAVVVGFAAIMDEVRERVKEQRAAIQYAQGYYDAIFGPLRFDPLRSASFSVDVHVEREGTTLPQLLDKIYSHGARRGLKDIEAQASELATSEHGTTDIHELRGPTPGLHRELMNQAQSEIRAWYRNLLGHDISGLVDHLVRRGERPEPLGPVL